MYRMVRKKQAKPEDTGVRRCANVKSQKHPDVRCSCPAIQGDFCARHAKNPKRFVESLQPVESPILQSTVKNTASEKIQRWWRPRVGRLRFQRQGPAANFPVEAENQTDIYTLDATSSIPMMYRWSYADSRKHIWIFDVRSLSMTRAQDTRDKLLNPYTREEVPSPAEVKYQDRCKWLRDRKYCLVHLLTDEMTPEQLWHQRILDVTMKYDALGYHTCLNWFEELAPPHLWLFYNELWELWFYRLQLSPQVKQQVVPNWNKPDTLLFKWLPNELRFRHDKKWWQKMMLDLLEKLVSSAGVKEHKILGALYGMTAFAIVSPRVRQHYPWLVEMEE